VHLEAGEDLRGAPRVVDELLPGAPELPVVRGRGEVERPPQELLVRVGLVRLDLGQQLLDEIVMSFEYRHQLSVPGGFRDLVPRLGLLPREGDFPPTGKLTAPCSVAAVR